MASQQQVLRIVYRAFGRSWGKSSKRLEGELPQMRVSYRMMNGESEREGRDAEKRAGGGWRDAAEQSLGRLLAELGSTSLARLI